MPLTSTRQLTIGRLNFASLFRNDFDVTELSRKLYHQGMDNDIHLSDVCMARFFEVVGAHQGPTFTAFLNDNRNEYTELYSFFRSATNGRRVGFLATIVGAKGVGKIIADTIQYINANIAADPNNASAIRQNFYKDSAMAMYSAFLHHDVDTFCQLLRHIPANDVGQLKHGDYVRETLFEELLRSTVVTSPHEREQRQQMVKALVKHGQIIATPEQINSAELNLGGSMALFLQRYSERHTPVLAAPTAQPFLGA